MTVVVDEITSDAQRERKKSRDLRKLGFVN